LTGYTCYENPNPRIVLVHLYKDAIAVPRRT